MNRCVLSPAHEDVANCCAPNLTQVGALFVRSLWMRAADGLAMMVPGPCEVQTDVGGVPTTIREETAYPFGESAVLRVDPRDPVEFTLHIRIPSWATSVSAECPGAVRARAGDWLLVTKTWRAGDSLGLSFGADVRLVPSTNGEYYIRRGPLLYAIGIAAIMKPIKDYPVAGFHDYLVFPAVWGQARWAIPLEGGMPALNAFSLAPNPKADPRYPWDQPPSLLRGSLVNLDDAKTERVDLVPMGCADAMLRRMTFPAAQ